MSSAPALFQKTMDTILQGLSSIKCYLDDISVTGAATDQEQLRNLERVLKRLQTQGLHLKRDKCSFLEPSVEYLGFCVDAVGLYPSLDKLRAVTQAPKPQNVQELRSFLGLINYYRSFVPTLSSLLFSLHTLPQKDRPWRWTRDCDAAFQKDKYSLVLDSVLVHYSPSLPIRVAADSGGERGALTHICSKKIPPVFARKAVYTHNRSLTSLR